MHNQYRSKSDAALLFIIKDAGEAARCMKSLENWNAEAKYLDQVNDACSELYRRQQANRRKSN